MGTEKPMKLYFLITGLLIIAVIVLGVMLKNFLGEKFPDKEEEAKESEENLPDEVKTARAIYSVAFIIFISLVLIFVIFKMASRKA